MDSVNTVTGESLWESVFNLFLPPFTFSAKNDKIVKVQKKKLC